MEQLKQCTLCTNFHSNESSQCDQCDNELDSDSNEYRDRFPEVKKTHEIEVIVDEETGQRTSTVFTIED